MEVQKFYLTRKQLTDSVEGREVKTKPVALPDWWEPFQVDTTAGELCVVWARRKTPRECVTHW